MLVAVRKQLEESKLDALFITNKTNIFYLTGFRGSNGSVLVTRNHLYLFTDARYLEKAEKSVCKECRVVDIAPGMMNVIHTALVKHRVKKFAVEGNDLSYNFFQRLDSLNGFKIVDSNNLIGKIRMIKNKEELRFIRQSQKLNEQVLRLLLPELKIGVTESTIAWQLQLIAKDIGACGLSFDPIIAFGGNSAIPHHESSSNKKLRRGDLVLIDMGLQCKNYASDMTRTFFTKIPTKQQAHIYETVLEANERAIKAVKAGVTADEVDKAARKFICDSGYHKKFGHATGHGIGMDVHEYPAISKGSETILQENMVLAIEPGIYLPGKLGVRIEDMVEVTGKGYQVMTKFGKGLKEVTLKL